LSCVGETFIPLNGRLFILRVANANAPALNPDVDESGSTPPCKKCVAIASTRPLVPPSAAIVAMSVKSELASHAAIRSPSVVVPDSM